MLKEIKNNLKYTNKRILNRFKLTNLHSRLFKKFSNESGLVYFGAVDSRNDDTYSPIKGFTTSMTHIDRNFCVGTIDNRDVLLVSRSDVIWQKDGLPTSYDWTIAAFKLKTVKSTPHFLIRSVYKNENYFDGFKASTPAVTKVEFGSFENYSDDFKKRFEVLATISNHVDIERLIPSRTASTLAAHFWPFSLEVGGDYIYVYSTNKQITINDLRAMTRNGLWLAQTFDSLIDEIELV